jgi:hypothetical protein
VPPWRRRQSCSCAVLRAAVGRPPLVCCFPLPSQLLLLSLSLLLLSLSLLLLSLSLLLLSLLLLLCGDVPRDNTAVCPVIVHRRTAIDAGSRVGTVFRQGDGGACG